MNREEHDADTLDVVAGFVVGVSSDVIAGFISRAARRLGNEQEVVELLTGHPAALRELRTFLTARWGAGDPADLPRIRAALTPTAAAVLVAAGLDRGAESSRTRVAPGGKTSVR